MTAETAQKFKALEAQASTLFEIFTNAQYEPVAPAVLQPADIFLDQIGEMLRARTYVFTAPDGEELCLRPDLTVPISRLYLERHPDASAVARYCYNGSAFRFQPEGRTQARPREFRQAGIENIGVRDLEKAEAETLGLTIKAVQACGLKSFIIRFGDLGLFQALIEALDIPPRWQARLKHQFWRPASFHDLLHRLLSDEPATQRSQASIILTKLAGAPEKDASEIVRQYLEKQGIPFVSDRSLTEIAERLLEKREDIHGPPLSKDIAQLIENYLAISGPPRAAFARIVDLSKVAQINIDGALQAYTKRLDLFAEADIPLSDAIFNAEFGRNLEYYTGFVFQLEHPELDLPAGHIGGGGRYDHLIGEIGKGHSIPAVGGGIHTERLLLAVEGLSIEGEDTEND
ncbi:MAG: ATP phosphoribosyltransferase regulatory subunit [Pseudomonadota bacterium]